MNSNFAICKDIFTPSESKRESEKDQGTIGRDQRKNFKHQRKFLISRSLLLSVNRILHDRKLNSEAQVVILNSSISHINSTQFRETSTTFVSY